MFKVFVLLKRKAGLSMADFIEHYESRHAGLGIEHAKYIRYYCRHYLYPGDDPLTGEVHEPEYDVVTEVHFESREAFDANNQLMRQPDVLQTMIEDEEKIFDRSKNRLVFVEDRISVLP